MFLHQPEFVRSFFAAAAGGLLCASLASAANVVDPGQGGQAIAGQSAAELSGLTYAGGTTYYAVSDSSGAAYELSITVDANDGTITAATIDDSLALPGATDLEGVAYQGGSGTIFVVDEGGPALTRRSLADGTVQQTVGTGMYTNIVVNFSLESLSLSPDGSTLWTANEQALSIDGPQPSDTVGSAVRIQQFDAAGNPTGQWAYIADPARGTTGNEWSGVVDLVSLPGGGLLVLERAFGGNDGLAGLPQFRSRIYEVDFTGASDTTGIAMLDSNSNSDLSDEPWTEVSKTLLWESTFANANFEGIALGPQLNGGEYSLLLISDNQSNAFGFQGLYPLVLEEVAVPEPGSGTLMLMGAGGLALGGLARRRKKSRV